MIKFLLIWIGLSFTPLYATEFVNSLRDGQQCQQQGLLLQSEAALSKALSQAQTPQEKAQAAGALGQIYYQLHQFSKAESLLKQAYLNTVGQDRANFANWLGNLYLGQQQKKQAHDFYLEAATLAGSDKVLALKVALNQVKAIDTTERLEALEKLIPKLVDISDVSERAHFYLHLGEQARGMGPPGLALAYKAFEQARQLSSASQLLRLQADSLDALASLYEDEEKSDESLRLTQQAIMLMQEQESHELLLTLEWRQARLLRGQKDNEAARAAYQRAVDHIEAIRQDIPVEYENGHSSFRTTLEPVYLGLADLLLEQAKTIEGESQQRLLIQARDTVELIKQSELEDFLGGRCTVAGARQAKIEHIDDKTAVLYPIILPQRLELLVGISNHLYQFTVPVKGGSLRSNILSMVKNLREGKPTQEMGIKLYHWLMSPMEELLKQQSIETLIFVPDGPLRLLPLASLYDGNQYVIEKYAVVTSPGMTLVDPKPLQHEALKMLLVGLSEPGPVVEKLPMDVLKNFIDVDDSQSENRSLPLADSTRNLMFKGPILRTLSKTRVGTLEQQMRDPEFISGLKEELKLPGVKREVGSLSQQISNTLFLDNEFTLDRFKQELITTPYPIVHIASHGIFSDTAENSFLMTYDELLRINELENLLRSEKFQKHPLELLTLSACQTAEGDDRAPLGFAGVALKAKARSALGTLWPIADQAAFTLMTEFYKRLASGSISKVKALQEAQLILLKQDEMKNPFYWSPFILVGNWL